MPDNKDKTFTNPLTDEHVREAERLKKAWFDHVLNSIERLAENVERVSFDLQASKNVFYKDIFEVKESLRKEIGLLHKDIDVDIDKAERRLLRAIDNVNKTIDALSVKEIRDELKAELALVKEESKKEIDSIKKEALIPLRDDVVKLRITMAKWGGLGGLIVSLILYTLRWIVPIIVSGLKHTP